MSRTASRAARAVLAGVGRMPTLLKHRRAEFMSSNAPPPTSSAAVRASMADKFRRDLVGPLPADVAPEDADLQRERLSEPPSHWYLTGFIAPMADSLHVRADDPDAQEEAETAAGRSWSSCVA